MNITLKQYHTLTTSIVKSTYSFITALAFQTKRTSHQGTSQHVSMK